MRKILSLALLIVIVAALLIVGCQKSVPASTAPVTGEATSEEQQISSSLDDLNDLDSMDQDLSSDLEELDNLTLE
ncbi:MAG: hypothetical protein AABX04_00700 [Nanoarchaeota archaeon]